METKLEQLFQNAPEVPAGLDTRVYSRIEAAAERLATREKYAWGAFFVFSLSAFIGSAVYATNAFAASNFGSYFSLIFSDTASIASWWKELVLSLVESLPIFGIVLFLATVSLASWSLRKFMRSTDGLIIKRGTLVA